MKKSMLRGAMMTVLTLFGGLALGIFLGQLLFNLLPGSSITDPTLMHMSMAAVPALGGFLLGGAAWGVQMGYLAHTTETRRLAWAGLLGFGPIVLFIGLGLSLAEPPLVANFGGSIGIHRLFTLIFTPSAFLIAGVSAWAIGRGLRDNMLARTLFWRVGLSAGLTFLSINLGMEALGWVVGAPGAAERATMLTVMGVGNLGAALVGGGVMGKCLSGTIHRKLPTQFSIPNL